MNCWIKHSTALALFLSFHFYGITLAQVPTPTSSTEFQMGIEVEMGRQTLHLVIDQFDINFLRAYLEKIPVGESFFDAYLENESALASLPEDVRRSLTDGLKLEKLEMERVAQLPRRGNPESAVEKQSTTLLDSSGIPLTNTSEAQQTQVLDAKGQLFETKIVTLPSSLDETAKEKPTLELPPAPDGLQLTDNQRKRQEWQKLAQRWKNLPFETKKSLVDLNQLGTHHKVALFIESIDVIEDIEFEERFGSRTHPRVHRSNEPLPPSWKQRLPELMPLAPTARTEFQDALQNLTYKVDGYSIEFVHKTPATNDVEMLQDLDGFLKQVGLSTRFRSPLTSTARGSTYHVHVSTRDSRDLTKLAELLNTRLLLRLIKAGYAQEAFSGEIVSYHDSVTVKGLLRLVDKSRIELRDHTESPEKELKEILSLLKMPEQEALTQLSREIQSLLDRDAVKVLSEKSPRALIDTVLRSSRNLSPNEIKISPGDPLLVDAAEAMMKNGNARKKLDAFIALAELSQHSDLAQKEISRFKRELPHNKGLQEFFIESVIYSPKVAKYFSQELNSTLKSKNIDPVTRTTVLFTLMNGHSNPRQLPVLLRSYLKNVKNPDQYTGRLFQNIIDLIRSGENVAPLLRAVPLMGHEYQRQALASALERGEPEVARAVVQLLNHTEIASDAARMIGERAASADSYLAELQRLQSSGTSTGKVRARQALAYTVDANTVPPDIFKSFPDRDIEHLLELREKTLNPYDKLPSSYEQSHKAARAHEAEFLKLARRNSGNADFQQTLASLLSDRSPQVRTLASKSLRAQGPLHVNALRAVSAQLLKSSPKAQEAVLFVLEKQPRFDSLTRSRLRTYSNEHTHSSSGNFAKRLLQITPELVLPAPPRDHLLEAAKRLCP